MASDSEEENSRLQHQHELKPIILRKFYHSFDELTSSAVHHHRPTGVRCGALLDTTNSSDIEFTIEDRAKLCGIIWPWNSYYQVWWVLTVFGAIVTMMLAPFQVAFECEFNRSFSALESVLNLLFTADIIVNFNLAVSRDEIILTEREQIAKEYFRGKLWVDVLGVSPFERIALLSCAKLFGHSSGGIRLRLAPLRLLQIVRFHRIKKFSHDLRYDARVSLLTFTLIRNFAVVVISCHCQACTMYYLAHLHNFDEGTWLGPIVHDSESIFECYITALYLSITTFCTVGYGDFSPANLEEKVAGSLFMVLNIAIAAWIIGSITLLILKGDETTSEYRDSLEVLHQYGAMHNFDETLMNRLRQQLRLDFNNREVADEQVLKYFPSAVRRKILRRLYKDSLVNTKIMKGVRLQFVDAFLTSCTVEIFSPGEEIVEKGSILSDLFLLVGGIAETVATPNSGSHVDCFECGEPCNSQYLRASKLEAGDFIGEVGFFTESPQIDSVISVTVCKTLTMSRQAYKILAQDHPGSAGKILQNLLVKVESASAETNLPRTLAELRLGSNYYDSSVYTQPVCCAQNESFTALKDLVTMHVRRTQDDDTTRLLFAASRGDTRIISLMCEHGFDPNNADYDHRTALHVASMKGDADAAKLLLKYKACPNKIDMHGSSPLLEACKSGNEGVMELLSQHGAKLCMSESQAASVLCQSVFDGDILYLKRLLKAGIDVNAADYDKRTASHIAAAEGNVAAIRILAGYAANFTLPDRWGNTAKDEAKRSDSSHLLAVLARHSNE